jgi:hypothetical protein
MYNIKHILLLTAFLSLAFIPATRESSNTIEKWVIVKGSSLKVDGQTNVNRFSCLIKNYDNPDTLQFRRWDDKSPAVALSGCIGLPVSSFDCMSNVMTNDLRKTLKFRDYPRLNIYFVSLKKYPALTQAEETIYGTVNIELAGCSKRYEIQYLISMDADQVIHLIGRQQIRFSDFNLTPPRKLGGIIKAEDELVVTFYINLKVATAAQSSNPLAEHHS